MVHDSQRQVVAWFCGGGLEGLGDVVGGEGVIARELVS